MANYGNKDAYFKHLVVIQQNQLEKERMRHEYRMAHPRRKRPDMPDMLSYRSMLNGTVQRPLIMERNLGRKDSINTQLLR